MNSKLRVTGIIFFLYLPVLLFGQTTVVSEAPVVKGTTVVIPGKEYKRSGYHNFFWGKHYRREWAQPVRVNNFYLDTAKGGLVPYEIGGGRQSKTLRLRSTAGKEYVLRSVNKDFGRALADEYRGTFVNRIMKDQVSMGHPFAGITIAPMSEAAGIYHTNPVIVFVPHQAALDSFDREFGDQLYLFEERPDESQEDAANFGNSTNVIGTDKLFEHIYKDNDNHVDQLAYLRARLFDMVIGDWGRHPGNWRWAKFKIDGENIYRPVPRDRDQAYSNLDGFYPSLAGFVYKPLQGFDKKIKNVSEWTSTARPLDRKFLHALPREVWIREAETLQRLLTDSVINSSIRLLPPELYPISGEKIIERIKSRRDNLETYANKYYNFLAKYTDLFGSQDKEYFKIQRLPGNITQVDIYAINKEGVIGDNPYYTRKFTRKETTEVRIYPLEGKDKIEFLGKPIKSVKIRVIDTGGNDTIIYESKGLHDQVDVSQGYKYEYDTAHIKRVDFSIRPFISSSYYVVFDRSPMRMFPRTGIKLLSSLTYIPQPWRKDEHESIHHICANYGIFRAAFNVGYIGRFGRLLGNWDLVLKARYDAPAVENFYGLGNESFRNSKETNNYYRTYSNRWYAGIGLERNFSKYNHIEISALYQSVKVERTLDHFITAAPVSVDPSVFERKDFAGAEAGYTYLNTDNQVFPIKGFGINVGVGYMTQLQRQGRSFGKAILSTIYFVPLSKQFSLAFKAGGGALTGEADYYNMNVVGGGGSGELKGYDRERFYGKHSAYLNGDLRWLFNTRNYFFNGKAGLLTFYDVGRVWLPGEKSNTWHGSYGFGVILVPYNKFSLSITYGISEEGGYANFKTGFYF